MQAILTDIPETIETDRLLLKMPVAGDGQSLHHAIIDGYDDYIKWLNWPKTPPSIATVEIECRQHHAEFILRSNIRYLIIEKKTQKIIGRCAIPAFQAIWSIPQFGLAYFISSSNRKQGFATEAIHTLATMAFQKLQAKKLEIYCDADNLASNKIPQKLNFQLEYTQRGSWPKVDNTLAKLHTYSMFNIAELPALIY